MFPGEPDVYEFLSIENSETAEYVTRGAINVTVDFYMAKVKHLTTRKAYTIMNLLGDYGGFQAAIIRMPRFLLVFYS